MLATGCTGRSPQSDPPQTKTPTSSSPAAPAYVRACHDSVYGNLGPNWRRGEITLGPVTFVGLRSVESAKPGRFTAKSGTDQGQKVLAVVPNDTRVTISVSPAEHVALLYDPATFSAHAVDQGDRAVAFVSCKSGQSPFGAQAAGKPTQFKGGFLVDGPQCVTIEAHVSAGVTQTTSVPFGRGQSCTRGRR